MKLWQILVAVLLVLTQGGKSYYVRQEDIHMWKKIEKFDTMFVSLTAEKFNCIISGVAFFRKRACQTKRLRLACQPGFGIKIQFALYGRFSSRYCGWKFFFNKRCHSTKSMSEVKRICEDKTSCSIIASNQIFGNPCRGTDKYLEVDYICK